MPSGVVVQALCGVIALCAAGIRASKLIHRRTRMRSRVLASQGITAASATRSTPRKPRSLKNQKKTKHKNRRIAECLVEECRLMSVLVAKSDRAHTTRSQRQSTHSTRFGAKKWLSTPLFGCTGLHLWVAFDRLDATRCASGGFFSCVRKE